MLFLVDVFYIIASIAVLVITGVLIYIARNLLQEMQKVGRVTEEISSLIQTVNAEVIPVVKSASTTLVDIDNLVTQVTKTADRVEKLTGGVERVLDTAHVATAATKAAKSTAAELISVYEGVKRGIKTLRG